MTRWHYGPSLIILLGLGWGVPALAHGTSVQFRKTGAIEIQAQYDGGTPMSEAQVTIYAPNDPATPWLQGTTDREGYFIFAPDPAQPGNWDVRVRQAGHGNIISIPVEPETAADRGTPSPEAAPEPTADAAEPELTARAQWSGANYTPLQKSLMAACGLWGLIGTALFFSRRKA